LPRPAISDYAPGHRIGHRPCCIRRGLSAETSSYGSTARGKRWKPSGIPGEVNIPTISRDEKRLLFTSTMAGPIDTWIRDLARGTEQRLITSPPFENASARWSPAAIPWSSAPTGSADVINLFLNLSDGQEQLWWSTTLTKAATPWSRDGRVHRLYSGRISKHGIFGCFHGGFQPRPACRFPPYQGQRVSGTASPRQQVEWPTLRRVRRPRRLRSGPFPQAKI